MNELSSYEHLLSLDEKQQKLTIEKSLVLQKALRSNDVDEIWKAQNYLQKVTNAQNLAAPQQGSHKSLLVDPFEVSSSMGYYRKQAQVSFDMLRAMGRAPIISAIITTRKDQVADFCTPQPDKYSKGFVIRKKNQKDKQEPTDQEKREIEFLTEFVLNCAQDEEVYDLQDFDAFIRMLVDDSLTLDQACFEVVHNRGGEVIQFLATDAATMLKADSYDNVNNIQQYDRKINGHYPSYVQMYQNRIVNEYYPWEMCFGIRNPRTAIQANGYGMSELEVLIQNVTAQLNSDSYNAKFFRHGTAPKGALLVKNTGGINKDKIAELRRDWDVMMSGVNNMHKTPILDGDKIEWLDLHKSNRDMEFDKYQQYLIKVACACYKISPEEIGFPLQGTQGNGMGSKEGGKQEKEYSQDKGLKPLLKSIQTWINKYIVTPKSQGKYEFIFAGLDTEDSEAEEERLQKAVTTYMEINEVRKVRDLDPLPYGDMILNQIVMQKMQGDMMQQQGQNPFTQGQQGEGDDDKENPFAKALQNWWDKEMTND